MRRWWVRALLVAILIGAAAGGYLAWSGQGARTWRYLDRRYGWTEAGRQAQFEALWAEAQRQYAQARPHDVYGFYLAEYPAQVRLRKHVAEVVPRLREAIAHPPVDNFIWSVLFTIDGKNLVREMLRQGDCPGWGQVQVMGLLQTEELQRWALEHPAPFCRQQAYQALVARGRLDPMDPVFLQTYVLKNQTQLTPSDADLIAAAMAMYDRLDRPAKVSLVQMGTVRGARVLRDGDTLRDWLDREQDPAVRQALLLALRDMDGLMAAIEQDGFFAETTTQDWGWQRQAAAEHPDSFLARGIKAYEAVRGLPYFAWDRRAPGQNYPVWWQYGNHQYDCTREIPGWEAYLKEFSRHEGAGDAAYRLGRCYEITGQYQQALTTLLRGTTLPNAEMASHARGRIIWILDALLDEQALRQLRIPELQPAIDYTLALRAFRAGRYGEAASAFAAILKAQAGNVPTYGQWLPFQPGVKKQQEQALKLAALAEQGQRYEIAAEIYHDELFFYNYLWGGGRESYLGNYAGHALETLSGDMDPAYSRWEAEFNNYIQSANLFAEILGDEKAAYSRAMALLKLERGYGPETALWKPRREIRAEAGALLEQFVADHPKSDLADDALLSLGYLRSDPAYFQRILKEYPRSDSAPTARTVKLSQQQSGYWNQEWVPFRYLTLETAPPAIAAWASATEGAFASRVDGGATYVLARAPAPGQTGTLHLTDEEAGVRAGIQWSALPAGPSYILARVETTRPIR